MNKSIYLVGTAHFDIAGPKRLKKTLNVIKPQVIVLEGLWAEHQKLIEERKKFTALGQEEQKDYIRSKGFYFPESNEETTRLFVNSLGYESWIPHEYSEQNGTKIMCVEDPQEYADAIKEMEGSNAVDAVKKLGREMLKLSPKRFQMAGDMLFEFGCSDQSNGGKCVERNKTIAKALNGLEGRIVQVIGAKHIFGREPTLRTLLSSYSPTAIKLPEADYL